MFREEDFLLISGLQHAVFCERQWALIHVEQLWHENRLTVEGRHLHARVHDSHEIEMRPGVVVTRSLRLCSYKLGLIGQADVVEFHDVSLPNADTNSSEPGGIALNGHIGLWRPVPIEYKRGRPKKDGCDEVQLCAQALCLEEMLATRVHQGFLFYGRLKRRRRVIFDDALRMRTIDLAGHLHELMRTGSTPRAQLEKKCGNCSLKELCNPQLGSKRLSVRPYLEQIFVPDKGEP